MHNSTFKYVYRVMLFSLVVCGWLAEPGAMRPALAQATNGPWLVYSVLPDSPSPGASGLWIAHSDGSGKRQVAKGKGIITLAASPDGRYVAYYAYDPVPDWGKKNITLDLLILPEGTTKTITPLTTPATEEKQSEDSGPTTAFELGWPPLQWSPDGQALAFIGAQGPSQSADLYVYSPKASQVTNLSDGPSQAIAPSWSPDGKYILHFGIEKYGINANGVHNGNNTFAGAWIARADGSGITALYKPTMGAAGSLGWVDSTSFLAWTWDSRCGLQNIRAFNVGSKNETVWFKDPHTAAAYDTSTGVLIVSLNIPPKSCHDDLDLGLYRLTKTSLTPVRIGDDSPQWLEWSPEAGVFFGWVTESPSHIIIITLDGKVSDLDSTIVAIPTVSPGGKYWAWIDDVDVTNTLNVAEAKFVSPVKIDQGVGTVIWAR